MERCSLLVYFNCHVFNNFVLFLLLLGTVATTLRVPYQSGASSPSSSPSSCSDPGPVVDISHRVSTLVLKPSFSQSLSLRTCRHLFLPRVDLLEFDHSVFGSHRLRCGRLSWTHYKCNIVLLAYLLTLTRLESALITAP